MPDAYDATDIGDAAVTMVQELSSSGISAPQIAAATNAVDLEEAVNSAEFRLNRQSQQYAVA